MGVLWFVGLFICMILSTRLLMVYIAVTFLVILTGCASGPITYEEIELEAYNTREAYLSYDYTVDNEQTFKQTVKAMNRAATRLTAFEQNVQLGQIMFAAKAQCKKGEGTVRWCPRGTPDKERKGELLHQFVSRYKVERNAQCRCASGAEVSEILKRVYQ